MSKTTTSKKVKYVGTEKFINVQTGEVEEMQVTNIQERDFNFHKIWMRNFIATLDLVGNQKTKLAFWIIDNLNKENQIAMNYRQIAEASDVSYQTVALTMKILMDADFIRKVNTCYMVNPDVIFKGTRNGRMNMLHTYQNAEYRSLTDEEKIENIEKSIDILQKELDQLRREQLRVV